MLGTEKVGDEVVSVCPLGIGSQGGLEKPGAAATKWLFNAGPCLKGDAQYLFAAFPGF